MMTSRKGGRTRLWWPLLVLQLAACGHDDSRVNSVLLWEGAADCLPCKQQAIALNALPSGTSLKLKAHDTYTVALELDPTTDPMACLYKWLSSTWASGERGYSCQPETPLMTALLSTTCEAPMCIENRGSDQVVIDVAEQLSCCSGTTLYHRVFDVEWIDGVAP
jgi:hypothetical protein